MSLEVNIKSAFYNSKSVLQNINFKVENGSILAIVGESGAGKTTIAKIISGLYKFSNLRFDGFVKSDDEIGFIPQNVAESLDPLFTIKSQMMEIENDINSIKENLSKVGFKDVEKILISYPHNLSGGERQRVLIAMALLKSRTIIADEFTSALDVNTQNLIINLLKKMNKESSISIIFITHNIDMLVFNGNMLVLFGGKVMEYGDINEIKSNPYHPYTDFLINSSIHFGMHYKNNKLAELSIKESQGCKFVGICKKAKDICYSEEPGLKNVNGRIVSCHF